MSAVIDVGLAIPACVTFRTGAGVRVEVGCASSSMLAGVGLALICLSLTPLALIARAALADVVVEAVLAGASIQTRVDGAFIDVRLTPRSVVASWAVAFEPSHHIHALSSV